MEISELDFELPEQLIARYPAAKRRQSRLLVANADSSSWHHHQFSDLPQWFKKGDLLVLNDTKVVPALLKLHKKTGGKIEALFLRAEGQLARCMISGSRLRPGVELFTESGDGKVELTEKLPRGEWLIKLVDGDWQQFLQQHGRPPLPPYIRRMRQVDGGQSDSDLDFERYQTIWARNSGSVAAPTASLHFDEEMVRSLQQQSVDVGYLSLHVGQGTFIPISCENVAEHPIHSEEFEVSDELRQQIISTKQKGGRVIAAGTTVCRALEASAAGHCGQTDLMIMPGFNFKVVDGLLTNFHTPRSTLLALVAAVAEHHGVTNGMNFVKQVYADAIRNEYRFYSYGDSSLWLKSAKID